MRPIVDESNEYQQFAIHNLAHELAHAHDHQMESRAFPGAFGTTISDFKEGILFQMAHACWNEYIASRLSARWGYDKYCKEFEDSLCPMLFTTRDQASASIDEYQKHRNMQKTANELVQVYGPLMTRLSYLVGHVHGMNSTVEGEAPTLHKAIAETKWFASIFRHFEEIVRAMYETYGKWTGLEVFEPLKQMFDDLLKAGGMTCIQMPDGNYFIGLNRPRD